MAALSRLDTLAHTNAWAQRHLADKALLALGLLIGAITLPPIPGAPLVFIAAIAAARFGARVRMADVVAIVRLPLAFVLISALTAAVSLRLRGGLALSWSGWRTALPLALRGMAGAAALGLFAVLVPIPELLARLRKMGVPAVVCELAMLMYRLIAVTIGEARASRQSQVQRLGYDGFANSMRSASLLIAGSVSRTMHRAERLNLGLAARGFEGDLPLLSNGAMRSARFELATVALLGGLVAACLAWALQR